MIIPAVMGQKTSLKDYHRTLLQIYKNIFTPFIQTTYENLVFLDNIIQTEHQVLSSLLFSPDRHDAQVNVAVNGQMDMEDISITLTGMESNLNDGMKKCEKEHVPLIEKSLNILTLLEKDAKQILSSDKYIAEWCHETRMNPFVRILPTFFTLLGQFVQECHLLENKRFWT